MDGYNRGDCVGKPWRSFRETFQPAHATARRRGTSLWIVEFGTVEGGPGQKADWIKGARRTMKDWDDVAGASYDHAEGSCGGYWVDTSQSSLDAFSRMCGDRFYR